MTLRHFEVSVDWESWPGEDVHFNLIFAKLTHQEQSTAVRMKCDIESTVSTGLSKIKLTNEVLQSASRLVESNLLLQAILQHTLDV